MAFQHPQPLAANLIANADAAAVAAVGGGEAPPLPPPPPVERDQEAQTAAQEFQGRQGPHADVPVATATAAFAAPVSDAQWFASTVQQMVSTNGISNETIRAFIDAMSGRVAPAAAQAASSAGVSEHASVLSDRPESRRIIDKELVQELKSEIGDALAAKLSDIVDSKLSGIMTELQRLGLQAPASSPSISAALIGRMAEEAFSLADREVVLARDAPGASIASSKEAESLRSQSYERDLVAAAYPLLSSIFPDRVLASSESFPWLPAHKKHWQHNLKPDMFWCHPGNFDARIPASPAPGVLYGALADARLCHDVRMIDSKLKMTNEALGETIAHLHHITHHAKSAFARGILFSGAELWLLEVGCHGDAIRRTKLAWDQRGSLDAVRAFLGPESTPTRLLRDVCARLGMTVDMPVVGSPAPSAFLGRGGSGTVYALSDAEKHRVAVKLCTGQESSANLSAEYMSFQAGMRRTGNELAHVAVEMTRYENIWSNETICSFAVLARVGSAVPLPTHAPHLVPIFRALDTLHRIGVVHGDARLPNLILVDQRLMWIDLVLASLPATLGPRRHDWNTLIDSIAHRLSKQATSEAVDSLVDLVCPRTLGADAELELGASRDSVLLQLADVIFDLPELTPPASMSQQRL